MQICNHIFKKPSVSLFFHFFAWPSIPHGLPRWLSGKESACQCRSHGFGPWLGKIPWRRNWQPTSVFLPGESHGRKSLVATVHGVAKSRTRLSDFTFFFSCFLSRSLKQYLSILSVFLWLRSPTIASLLRI